MIFYDSFWEVAQILPQESQNDFIACLVRYYFTGEIAADEQLIKIAFASCKPFIDMSKKASKAGKKSAAARSKKSANGSANGSMNGSANGSMNGSANKEQNTTEQNTTELTPTGVGVGRPPTRSLSPVSGLVSIPPAGDVPSLQETVAVATGSMGVSEEFARWWHGEMTARDWTNTDGTTIGRRNWRPVLKAWWNNRRDGEMREINEAARASKERERVYSPADWGLCRERCAKCGEHGCTAGAKVPPQFWTPPQQPEQCPRFKQA